MNPDSDDRVNNVLGMKRDIFNRGHDIPSKINPNSFLDDGSIDYLVGGVSKPDSPFFSNGNTIVDPAGDSSSISLTEHASIPEIAALVSGKEKTDKSTRKKTDDNSHFKFIESYYLNLYSDARIEELQDGQFGKIISVQPIGKPGFIVRSMSSADEKHSINAVDLFRHEPKMHTLFYSHFSELIPKLLSIYKLVFANNLGRTIYYQIEYQKIDGIDCGELIYLINKSEPRPISGFEKYMNPDNLLPIAFHVSRFVSKTHQDLGVILRDIKPDNIMIGREGDIYAIDLGLASLASEVHPLEGILGSLPYMAPEVIGGFGSGYPSDVYSLALTIWELFQGFNPQDDLIESCYDAEKKDYDDEKVSRLIVTEGPIGILREKANYNHKLYDPKFKMITEEALQNSLVQRPTALEYFNELCRIF